jgi:hypothetical protein
MGAMFLILVAHYLVLWSAVKNEYRNFVSKGKKVQIVLVTPEEASAKYIDLMTSVNAKKYQRGIELMVNRVGYIQFFAASLDYVPRKVPFQEGDIYWAAVQHNLVPRFINPNKQILDDSKHTSKYTGIKLSGREKGSSFSLGYIADAYIDFGKVGMHVVLLVMGYGFGLIYEYFVKRSPNALWQWIFTCPLLILFNINGTDTKKAIGWAVLYFLTVALIRGQLIKKIDPFLQK